METESYLSYGAGYSKINVTLQDIRTAIADLQKMDEEHGAFWVAIVNEGDNVLETHKDLTVIGIFEDDPDNAIRQQIGSLTEIESLYELFLKGEFVKVKAVLKTKR